MAGKSGLTDMLSVDAVFSDKPKPFFFFFSALTVNHGRKVWVDGHACRGSCNLRHHAFFQFLLG